MAVGSPFLSLARFDDEFSGNTPRYEYWFGEALPKAMPTALHGAIQAILITMLLAKGWRALPEVKLKISRLAQPVPDLIASNQRMEAPYPTRPFPLCVEILSPEDSLRKVFEKAAHYLDWGIEFVWIIDPVGRRAFTMSAGQPSPAEVSLNESLIASHGLTISLSDLFEQAEQLFQ